MLTRGVVYQYAGYSINFQCFVYFTRPFLQAASNSFLSMVPSLSVSTCATLTR
jgi:hypothetical protein